MVLGEVKDNILDEGFHFKLPFITQVYLSSVRVHLSEVQASAASKDLQQVSTKVALNWRPDPVFVNKIYQELGRTNEIIYNIIHPAVNEVFKAAAAKKTAEQILQQREDLKKEVDTHLKQRLEVYHLAIVDVSLVDVDFSPEFNRAIEAKQIAEQKAQQAVYEAQRVKAEAQAAVNKAEGQAEAQKLVRSSLTQEILTKEAIEKWDGRFPMVMGGDALPFIDLKDFKNEKND